MRDHRGYLRYPHHVTPGTVLGYQADRGYFAASEAAQLPEYFLSLRTPVRGVTTEDLVQGQDRAPESVEEHRLNAWCRSHEASALRPAWWFDSPGILSARAVQALRGPTRMPGMTAEAFADARGMLTGRPNQQRWMGVLFGTSEVGKTTLNSLLGTTR